MTSMLGITSEATVRASVALGPGGVMPLSPLVEPKLVRVVVDTHLHLPDMFELTFLDEDGNVLSDAGIQIGTAVQVSGGASGSSSASELVEGEVTSIEAVCADLHILTVVRGYSKAHRLQRAKNTSTYVNQTDGDIARSICLSNGLTPGTIDDPGVTHDHIAQVNQTDWDFLRQRAMENGYETGVSGGQFYFRKPSGPDPGGGGLGGLAGAVGGAISSALGGGPPTLTFRDDLMEFYPRITAGNMTPNVEVRVWDQDQAQVVTAKEDAATHTAKISGEDPKALATSFGSALPIPIPSIPSIPGLPSLGALPTPGAHVITDRPVASGSAASTAADKLATGVAEHLASTFAEAEGLCTGNPGVQAGAQITIAAVPSAFAGTWTVTNARHVFDEEHHGYMTQFWVSGRADRTLAGLTGGGPKAGEAYRIPGLVCGVVTNNNDPNTSGRVKVALPWLSPTYESDWVRVVQVGSGKSSGSLFTPETGDEVMVGFEFGDPRRPYVLGGLRNGNTSFDLGGAAVHASGMAGTVVRRGIVAPTGTTLLFQDELTPPPPMPGGIPTASSILLGTADESVSLKIDQVGSTLTLTCNPAAGPGKAPIGTLKIECGQAGTVEIKTGQGGQMTIDGGAQLKLTAQASIDIESQGTVSIKGTAVQLN
ncbi:MAG TPA: phage baseplate assembly protein V [Pseudonocardiaceae bacterium]|jgi:hypothetical protein|nr:phage baseplate assembly protein V [Pseudonocardiaceae bacterium]